MSEYLLGVIGTVLFSALLTAIVPNGKTATIIRSTARLACLIAVLSPLLSFMKSGELFGENFTETVIQTDGGFIEYCSKISIENAQKSLKEHLAERYGEEFEVTCKWESVEEKEGKYAVEKIKIVSILVEASGAIEEEKREEIERYVAATYGCSAEVTSVE